MRSKSEIIEKLKEMNKTQEFTIDRLNRKLSEEKRKLSEEKRKNNHKNRNRINPNKNPALIAETKFKKRKLLWEKT